MRRTLSLISPPRIHELLFAAVLVWLFAAGQGWSVLLADGDTGWHIRNGEQILATGRVPYSDVFGFGSGGRDWFAWEWLTDVFFALLFQMGGLKGVAVCCGILISASVSLLFRHILWRSVNVVIALPLALVAVGASSVHFLARPHVFGLLFFATACWMIDRDRACPARLTFTLPLLVAVWTNCHGSFLAGIALLGIWTIEPVLKTRRFSSRRVFILLASGLATFCNPYGWRLHAHAIAYLRSTWIQTVVEEFQSPSFRSENMLQFEILLLGGIAALPWLLRRKEFYPTCLILFWAHEALTSVRHVPLYCIAACPVLGTVIQDYWHQRVRVTRADSLFVALNGINSTWSPWTRGLTVWPVVLSMALTLSAVKPFASGPALGFPANKFPVNLVERNIGRFTGETPLRVFSSDQWSDYLIFRLYPTVRIYFDGRSDFFGPWRGTAYQQLMAGRPQSASILITEGVGFALIPKDWALSGILQTDKRWHVADADELGVLLVRDFVRDAVKFDSHPNQNLNSRR